MNNPNHPSYFADNIHLLNNMNMLLGATQAGQASEQHKQYIIQNQYGNPAVHPMNLATTTAAGPSVVQTTTIDPVALVYQQQQQNEALLLQQHQQQHQQQHYQQQQPISYKIPQLGTVSVVAAAAAAQVNPSTSNVSNNASSSTSMTTKKKDIVAEAIRAAETPEIKKEPISTTAQSNNSTSESTSTSTVVKSEPSTSTSTPSKPANANTGSRPGPKPGSTRGSRGAYGPRGGGMRQQIMPRLQLLDDEDDGVTCRMCLQPFWYKSQLFDHLKSVHSISDPERYEKEEREKKLRRLREDQQRMAMAQRGRGLRGRGGGMLMRGRGGVLLRGGVKRPLQHTGPRPSFQYRDGSFICDLCKKSFSDGNDMVTHWKSHVKQQRASLGSASSSSASSASYGKRGRPPGSKTGEGRGRGRGGRGRGRRPSGEPRAGRSDKGRPRWTAYLLWSTRRRKELTAENEGYTFAQIGRTISDEWKKVEGEELDKLKEEADRLNFEGIRKLPTSSPESGSGGGGGGSSSTSDSDTEWSEEEDPSFDETNVKKPIMLKIKREATDRGSRQRKRPSFFQDYENEENNLDKILDEFEQEQILEAKVPREPKPKKEPKTPGEKKAPRKRRQPSPGIADEDKEIELETSRSGRVRKIRRRKVFAFDEEEDESHTDDEDRDEYQPDSEPEEPDEEYIDEVSEVDDDPEDDENGYNLPLKKRKTGGEMTKEDIEAAKRAAFAAKPHIVVDSKKLKGKDYRDEIDSIIKPGDEDNLDFSDDELSQVLKMQVKKEPDTEPIVNNDQIGEAAEQKLSSEVPEDVSLNTPVSNQTEDVLEPSASTASVPSTSDGVAAQEPEEETAMETNIAEEKTQSSAESADIKPSLADLSAKPAIADEESGLIKEDGGSLEGSVTEEGPQDNPFDSDNDVVDDEPVPEEEPAEEEEAPQAAAAPAEAEEPQEESKPSEDMVEDEEDTSKSSDFRTANNVVNGQSNAQEEEQPPQQQPILESSNPDQEEQSSAPEAPGNEETPQTAMEQDEQYKNITTDQSQMDNIFN